MDEILKLLLYTGLAVGGLIFSGFVFYYAGRLVGLGVMRSMHDFERYKDRLERRTG